ncbi:hypothetical protein BDV29DRAFT_151642 [Aspergillus leporis]|uniref:WD40-repeat-containing domain protein n=1 Tax=Aspergillus leporis TaxID=41062 RepID=A0A5N5XG77_9EURO|nr:hypothetical protein BDV29DRAFT_151642 [Aspergillus leporis]
MKAEALVGSCSREGATGSGTDNVINVLAFDPSPEINVLMVPYVDGELVVYDLWTTELCCRIEDVFAYTLACSPVGRTLGTGSSQGAIHIFDFAGARVTN